MQHITPQGDIGLIGLAVMGQNLVLNMNDHGYTVVVYNRTTAKVDEFLVNEAKGTKVQGAHSIEELVAKLKRPRRVMMLVKAGKPVDDFIAQLVPYLEPGDIIIDGGNSLFDDTNRRQKELESKGLLFIGTGVSGGEEGARLDRGLSLRPCLDRVVATLRIAALLLHVRSRLLWHLNGRRWSVHSCRRLV